MTMGRFFDLVDQQHHLLLRGKRLSQLAQLDIAGRVVHAVGAELAVVEPLHHVVDVEAVLGLGGGLHVPDNELLPQRLGYGLGQHGLAGARLALNEKRLFQRHGNVHRRHQLAGGHVLIGSRKNLVHSSPLFRRFFVSAERVQFIRYQSPADSATANFTFFRRPAKKPCAGRRDML